MGAEERFSPIGTPKGEMRGYRYAFLDEDGFVEGSVVLCAASDKDACELASDLLKRSECPFVQVRKGTSIIFQIGRGGSNSHGLPVTASR